MSQVLYSQEKKSFSGKSAETLAITFRFSFCLVPRPWG
jgi:hypothetical protein